MRACCLGFLLLAFVVALEGPILRAQSSLVKVTPLGSISGELCAADRAMLFEDPSGVRILYDPGITTDETDARLGNVHVILLSHGHGDHVGVARINRSAPPACATIMVPANNPNTNVAAIAAAQNAAVILPGLELNNWMALKIQAIRGTAPGACATGGLGNQTDVPVGAAPCLAILQPGGSRVINRAGGSAGVRITAVQAIHGSSIPAAAIDSPGLPPGILGSAGNAAGFVVKFTNGLTAYLTGDTELFGDMQTIISNFYKPTLTVLNMDGLFTMGPDEAMFMMQNLQRPTTVLLSHASEAATSGGRVNPGTKIEAFARQANKIVDVVIAVSDTPLTFDGTGRCVGCAKQ